MSPFRQFHGTTEEHVVSINSATIHRDCQEDFLRLKNSAAQEGIDLQVASSFRSFDRQLIIWQEKIQGIRPILDDNGKERDTKKLSPKELILGILRWSALPGFSRHHWGTDMDVYDGAAQITPKLLPEEFAPKGPFAKLAEFLVDEPFDFRRPYQSDQGGVAPEPWHISHSAAAQPYEEMLNLESARAFLQNPPKPIPLAEVILENLNEVFERFILPKS